MNNEQVKKNMAEKIKRGRAKESASKVTAVCLTDELDAWLKVAAEGKSLTPEIVEAIIRIDELAEQGIGAYILEDFDEQ